jgi:hypothetical protein
MPTRPKSSDHFPQEFDRAFDQFPGVVVTIRGEITVRLSDIDG